MAKAAGIYFRIDLTFFYKIVIILNVRIITILFCNERKQGRNVNHGHIIALSDNGESDADSEETSGAGEGFGAYARTAEGSGLS